MVYESIIYDYAAYACLCWGSFFFLNHCHLWQANPLVHFQIVTGDSMNFLTQLPMLCTLPVLSSWLWLFQGRRWAMLCWMLCWRGMLTFWNGFLQYIIHNYKLLRWSLILNFLLKKQVYIGNILYIKYFWMTNKVTGIKHKNHVLDSCVVVDCVHQEQLTWHDAHRS